MALLYAIGDGLITRDELVEKSFTGATRGFTDALVKAPRTARLEFSSGLATAENVVTAASFDERGQPIGHEPIGIGKPLTIEIRTIYTGKFPRGGFLVKSKDMLVTSAMKGIEVYEGAPRAINLLAKSIEKYKSLRYNDPTQPGTPLIFYSPALTNLNSVLKVEIAFNEFPQQVFDTLAKAVKGAAGIPVFAPASAYLFVAGEILNLISMIGEATFDSGPEFAEVTPVTFDRPGDFPTVADFRLLMADRHSKELKNSYRVNQQGELVHQETSDRYDGDYPYVVLSFDGRKRDAYKDFTPTAATADILQGFFGSKDVFSAGVEVVVNAMKLYNDWKFREVAVSMDRQIKELRPDDPDHDKKRQELTASRDAAIKNIQKDELKPKSN